MLKTTMKIRKRIGKYSAMYLPKIEGSGHSSPRQMSSSTGRLHPPTPSRHHQSPRHRQLPSRRDCSSLRTASLAQLFAAAAPETGPERTNVVVGDLCIILKVLGTQAACGGVFTCAREM